MKKNLALVLLLLSLLLPLSVRAADLFGLGSRNAALAGATSAVCDDGAASWYNPALLAATDAGGLTLYYVSMFPSVQAKVHDYGSLGNIEYYQGYDENGLLSSTATTDRIDALYRRAAELARFSGLGINFSVRFHELFDKLPFALVFGGSALIPQDGRNLASFSAQTVDQPFFPSWNTPFNQLRMNLGLGAEVWPGHLWLGAGFSVHSKVEGAVDTFTPLASYDPGNPDHNRPDPSAAGTTQSLGLRISPSAGLLYSPASWGRLSVVFHGEEHTTINLKARATMVLDLGEPLVMEVPYEMTGTFAYRPHRIVAGLAYLLGESLTVTAELEFGMWKNFADKLQILTMRVSDDALQGDDTIYLEDLAGDFRVASEDSPPIKLQQTWNPRVGAEYKFPCGFAARLGYGYRMSPLVGDQNHLNSFLDNNWHTLAAGIGFDFLARKKTGKSLAINAHFQGLILEPRYQAIGKADANGDSIAGGYVRTEGFISGFGVELSSRF
jgi:long-subunit fatty acid transport protein